MISSTVSSSKRCLGSSLVQAYLVS